MQLSTSAKTIVSHKYRNKIDTTTHTDDTNTGWHQNNKNAIEVEILPIPPHTQQQSTNSTYTSKRVKGVCLPLARASGRLLQRF
jgi:hypothetical protein